MFRLWFLLQFCFFFCPPYLFSEFRKARGYAGKIMYLLMSVLNGLRPVNTIEAVLSMERTVSLQMSFIPGIWRYLKVEV